MKVLVFVAFLCILPLISAKPIEKATSKCIVAYLKNQGFLGGKKETPKELTEACSATVDSEKAAIIEKFRAFFAKDDDTKDHVECLITALKKTPFFDRELIEKLDFSKAKVGKDVVEISEGLGALTSVIQIMRAQKSCVIDTAFDEEFVEFANEAFVEFFENNEDEEDEEEDNETLIADYCVRKHLFDNNLITFNRDSFKVNPKNVDTAGVNCDEVYAVFVKALNEAMVISFDEEIDIEGESESDTEAKKVLFNGCFTKKAEEKHFADNLAPYDYVKELDLTPEQKEELRVKWVALFKDLVKSSMVCSLPLFA